jgi:predicted Zn-dependent protease
MDAQAAEVALLPDSADTRRLRGEVGFRHAGLLGRLGRTSEAEKILAGVDLKAFGDEKDHSSYASLEKDVELIRGVIAAGGGRDAEAVTLLKDSLEGKDDKGLGMSDYFPQQYFARMALAQSLGRLGKADEAGEALAPILKQNPRFAPALTVLARIRGEKPAGPPGATRPAGSAS